MGKLRKVYRLLGLVFPFLYFVSGKNLVLTFLFPLSFFLLVIEVLRFKFPQVSQKYFQIFSLIAKKREEKTLLGTTYLVWGTLLTILAFEKQIVILALLFLIFGDIASFYFRKIRILAVFATCLMVGLIFTNVLGANLSLAIILIGALVATLSETMPLKIGKFYLDDNLTIPVFSGLAMTLVKSFF